MTLTSTADTDLHEYDEDVFGTDMNARPGGREPKTPVVKMPGDFPRRGPNGPPMVSDPAPDAPRVKSGQRKGRPKLLTYGRPSGITEIIENTYGLVKWEQRRGVVGFGRDHTLVTRAANVDLDDPAARGTLDGIWVHAVRAGDGFLAADRGTFIHAITEDEFKGRSWASKVAHGIELGIPEEAQHAMVAALQECIARHGLVVLASELRMVNDRYRLAGTTDWVVELTVPLAFARDGEVVARLEPGPRRIADTKTGEDVDNEHPEGYLAQLAAYAGSCGYDTELEERIELPWPLDQEHGLIFHLPVLDALAGRARCELLHVDLTQGFELLECVSMRDRLYARKDGFAWAAPVQADCKEISVGGVDGSANHRYDVVMPAAATEADPFDFLNDTTKTDAEIRAAGAAVVAERKAARLARTAAKNAAAVVADVTSDQAADAALRIMRLHPAGHRTLTARNAVDGITLDKVAAGLTPPMFRALLANLAAAEETDPDPTTASDNERYCEDPMSRHDPEFLDQIGSDKMRTYLVDRVMTVAQNREALAEFLEAMTALAMPKLSEFTGHTNRQLRTIEHALVRVEVRHGIHVHTVIHPPVAPPDEGRDATPTEVADARTAYEALSLDDVATVNQWTAEARAAGYDLAIGGITGRQTELRVTNLHTRIALLAAHPEQIRAAVAFVTNDEWPNVASIPLGACLGALTISELHALTDLAAALPGAVLELDRRGAHRLVA